MFVNKKKNIYDFRSSGKGMNKKEMEMLLCLLATEPEGNSKPSRQVDLYSLTVDVLTSDMD